MTNEQEELITNWIEDAQILLTCHLSMAESTRRKHRNIGILSAVLSAIVGSSIFASLGQDNTDRTLVVLTGLISLIATILTSVLAFLKLPEIANQYHNSGNDYAAIRKELEFLLLFKTDDNKQVENEIKRLKIKWDDIRKNSIPISIKTIEKFNKESKNS
ncbi:SLATT domain-containing protein [Aquimarina sp. D1M17]|uniref:SLATT domain-containing protein n=1 Tax=Aquimarina acroporae TaxID=2937283 RepID=UPI0020BEBF10|nr:SLATT domain-containing protein [Aquimarina acroporae]MCK8520641.1 SLATT domain-containing protein [Aquimarina acroporae]